MTIRACSAGVQKKVLDFMELKKFNHQYDETKTTKTPIPFASSCQHGAEEVLRFRAVKLQIRLETPRWRDRLCSVGRETQNSKLTHTMDALVTLKLMCLCNEILRQGELIFRF